MRPFQAVEVLVSACTVHCAAWSAWGHFNLAEGMCCRLVLSCVALLTAGVFPVLAGAASAPFWLKAIWLVAEGLLRAGFLVRGLLCGLGQWARGPGHAAVGPCASGTGRPR